MCGGDKLTRLAVADVVGHGEAVSRYSQMIYDEMVKRMGDMQGDELLADVNRIASGHGVRAMATAALVAFSTVSNQLYFSYAGHPPAMIKRHADAHWQPAPLPAVQGRVANVPLAVAPDATFDQQSAALCSGDRVFICTDGVLEAPSEQDGLFGVDRLTAVLDAHAADELPMLKRAVLDEVRSHTGGPLTHDDVTFMAVEVR